MKFDLLRAAARNEVPVHTASASGDARSQFLGWSPRPTGDPLVHGLVKRETDPLCGYEYADRSMYITQVSPPFYFSAIHRENVFMIIRLYDAEAPQVSSQLD